MDEVVRRWDLGEWARRRPVVRNALALALTGGVARLFDAGYRVVVARLIGPETVGLLQMAGSVYGFAFGLATLGLSPAVARLVAAGRPVHQVATTARALVGPSGLVSALLLAVAAPWLAHHVLSDPRVVLPLRVLALGLIPASCCGVLRGRFQGLQRMTPLAWAQVLEPAIRLGATLGALVALPALWPLPVPLPPAALLAALGVLGEGTECLFLAGWTVRDQATQTTAPSPSGSFSPAVAGQLLRLGIPLMLSQFLLSTAAVADASLTPRLLALSGLSAPDATREYGRLHGMVLPFLFFPMTLVFPLGAVLIPGVAEARAARDYRRLRRRLTQAVAGAVAVEAAAALLYLLVPDRLASLVGGGPAVTALIRGLAIWVPFAYLDYIGSSALIGFGATQSALANGLLNAAVRLGLSYLLVPHPAMRLKGALLALAAGDAVATGAHFLRLTRWIKVRR